MKAAKLFLLLTIATVMACEPSASTCLYEEPSTAEADPTVVAPTNPESILCDHTHEDDPASIEDSTPPTNEPPVHATPLRSLPVFGTDAVVSASIVLLQCKCYEGCYQPQ